MLLECFAVLFFTVTVADHGQYTNNRYLPMAPKLADIKDQINECDGKFVCGVIRTPKNFSVECINATQVCDGIQHCKHGIDEHDCPRMCEGLVICPDRKTCAKPCDDVVSCPGSEDEQNCPPKCPKPKLLCNDRRGCATTCDGISECPFGTDEMGCPPNCTEEQVLCADGKRCAKPCDGHAECEGDGDELDCPFQCKCTPGQYICLASEKCINREGVCEGGKRKRKGKEHEKDKGKEHEKGKGKEREKDKGKEHEKGKGKEHEKGKGKEHEKGKGKEHEKDKRKEHEKHKRKDRDDVSCFTGMETGDDESNTGFGFECTPSGP